MKPAAEIGKILAIGRSFAFFPVHLAQTLGKVKRDFSLRRVEGKCAIPRPAIGAIEPAALGTGVSKSRIHDVPVGNSEYQFVDGDPRQQVRFPQQPFVGCALELEKIVQVLRIGCEPGQYAGAVLAVARGNQAMSVVLMKLRDPRRH